MATPSRAPAAALASCLALGLLSLVVPSALGYDAWAWLVWGRELLHLDLQTTGGPSFKPLPPILVAPFTLVDGLAPSAWLVIVRASAFAALLLAYRIARGLTSSVAAGVAAAVFVGLCTDVFVTTLRGYSEPLLVALVLGAVDQHLRGRRRGALACSALAGLLRPEVWLFTAVYGLWLLLRPPRSRSRIAPVLALVVAPPLLWLSLDLAGSGDALRAGDVAQTAPAGSAARADAPALAVLGHAASAVLAPVLVLFAAGAVVAIRRRDGVVLALCGLSAGWVALVGVMAEAGYPGRRRYLVAAAVLASLVAAVGLDALVRAVPPGGARVAAGVAAAAVIAAVAFAPLRTDGRLVRLAERQEAQLDELRLAVERSGGASRVTRVGTVVVNPFPQTALAWDLDTPLAEVVATWTSTRRRPGWSPPALVFTAPAKLAGRRPAIPRTVATRPVARAGRWRVLLARRGPVR